MQWGAHSYRSLNVGGTEIYLDYWMKYLTDKLSHAA